LHKLTHLPVAVLKQFLVLVLSLHRAIVSIALR